jgi:hypothetical protein
MNWLPDDVKEASGGETIDNVARDSIRLAHAALDRFPDLVRKHKIIAGGAAISSSLVIVAGVAIARRMRKGQSAEDAVAGVTEDEIDRPERVSRPRPSSHADAKADTPAAPDTNGVAPTEEVPSARVD